VYFSREEGVEVFHEITFLFRYKKKKKKGTFALFTRSWFKMSTLSFICVVLFIIHSTNVYCQFKNDFINDLNALNVLENVMMASKYRLDDKESPDASLGGIPPGKIKEFDKQEGRPPGLLGEDDDEDEKDGKQDDDDDDDKQGLPEAEDYEEYDDDNEIEGIEGEHPECYCFREDVDGGKRPHRRRKDKKE